jgi:hypothetical protein
MGEHIARSKKIFKVCVPYDPPALVIHDAILHEGRLWIVSAWLENLHEGYRTPERIVCPRHSQYDKPEGSQDLGLYQVDFSLRDSIPKAVVDGRARPEEAFGFLVKEAPGLRFPLETTSETPTISH